MADTGSNTDNTLLEMSQNTQPKKGPIAEVEFQVSQVIGRLEEAVIGKSTTSNNYSETSPNVSLCTENEPEHPSCPEPVIQRIEDLFTEESCEGESFPELTGTSRLSVVSHAVGALAGCMERNHVSHVSARITRDTATALTQLFRCEDYGVCYHDDQLEGLVRIVRALLHTRIQHYAEQGFLAFKNKLPVLYTSVAAPLGIVQHLCRQLGLPLCCINPVPVSTLFGSQKMDLAALERLIETDKETNKIPLIVLADAGTPIAGHVDNITRLQEICKKNSIWLHLRGHCLAALAVPDNSTTISHISDSMTLPLGIWLGIPGLPTATVYNQKALSPACTNLLEHPSRKLISLPLWTTFQSLGKDEIRRRFREAFEWCHQLWQRLDKYPNIRRLSQPPGGEGGLISLSEISNKPVSSNILFEIAACTVVFQFVPENVEGRVSNYYDKLNSWLGQMLQRDCGQVNMTLCELDDGEVVLRYCPLEPHPSIQEQPDFDQFISCLDQQIEILGATVEQKGEFGRVARGSGVLEVVEVDGWAGLGGVRYHPRNIPHATDQLTDQLKQQLNRLNIALVDRLRATDAAFSLGEGCDGLACVRFGMVTGDTDVAELLALVISAGQEEEESGRALDSMAELVKKGIEAAEQGLQEGQEGLLRGLPVVGPLVSWWSPRPATRGRSLDLTHGVVATTENIYRQNLE